MLNVKVTGVHELRGVLAEFSDRRFNSVVATTLTRSARNVENKWRGQLQGRFDRPTSLTIKGTVVRMATAQNMTAEVKARDAVSQGDAPSEYLQPHEISGSRRLKKFERALIAQGSMPPGHFALPGKGAQLDSYGNVSRGQIVQVLAQLGAQYSPGYQRVISKKAGRQAANAIKTGREYIAVLDNSTGIYPGVYQKTGKTLLPIFFYERSTRYRKRLDLISEGTKVANETMQGELKRAVEESFKSLRAKQS